MGFFTNSRVLFSTLALVGATLFGSGETAKAATLATFDIDGSYAITTDTAGSIIDIDGTFAGSLLAPFPPGTSQYILRAMFTLNGDVDFDESIQVAGDPADAAPLVFGLAQLLINNANTVFEFGDPVTLASLVYGGTLDVATATDVAGTYFIDAETFGVPASVLLNGLLDDIDPSGGLSAFIAFPNNDSGSFAIALSISEVPLPAGLPLLLAGIGGLAILRRRQPT